MLGHRSRGSSGWDLGVGLGLVVAPWTHTTFGHSSRSLRMLGKDPLLVLAGESLTSLDHMRGKIVRTDRSTCLVNCTCLAVAGIGRSGGTAAYHLQIDSFPPAQYE